MGNNKCTCNDPTTFSMDTHDEAYIHRCPYCTSKMWEAAKPTLKGFEGKIMMFGSVPNDF